MSEPSFSPVYTLPSDPEEIVRRLSGVINESRLAAELYWRIAREAGRELLSGGILLLFAFKVHDCVAENDSPPVMESVLWQVIPRWIDALVDDAVVAEDAKRKWHEATETARQSAAELEAQT